MQNNNSKLNTVLLVIVIILLAIGIWMLAVNNKVSERIESDTETNVTEDVVVKEQEQEVVQPEPVDPTIAFLKGLISTYPYAEIKECHWADGRQFTLNSDRRIADGSITIYNSNGVVMDTCPTFYDATQYTPSGTCQAMQGCGAIIYGNGIDTYNLK